MTESRKSDRAARRRQLRERRRAHQRPQRWLIAGGVGLLVITAFGFLAARLLGVTGDVNLFVHGKYVDKLDAGAPVAIGELPIGSVKQIETRDGRPVAHLLVERQHAKGIPSNSRFSVESLNPWLPGNVGVRIYPPETTGETSPIRDGALVEAINHSLSPPEIPPRFFLLLGAAIACVVVTLVIAVVFYKWVNLLSTIIVVLLGGVVLFGGYVFFQRRIAPPSPPWLTEQLGFEIPRDLNSTR